MTQTPQGWYLDPTPPPGHPPALRWWDGARWTEHVLGAPSTMAAPNYPGKATTTPDGVPLATWWQRVGATLIDGVITGLVTLLLGYPFIGALYDALRAYLDTAVKAADTGAPAPGQMDLYSQALGPILGIYAVGLLVSLVYTVGFLKLKAATPGKMVLGLQVRLRDTPGPLGWGTILRRWGAQYWYVVLSWVPFVGSLVSLYSLLDALWPLWDDKRQAIHDKFAGTNVVQARR